MDNHVLIHHGIKGQKWGVRRFQNEDGSRTSKGKQQDAKNNKTQKTVSVQKAITIGVTGAAIGAAAVGATWYYKNYANKKAIKLKNIARAKKAANTRAIRKAAGLYNKETFKNVDVLISKGAEYATTRLNVPILTVGGL